VPLVDYYIKYQWEVNNDGRAKIERLNFSKSKFLATKLVLTMQKVGKM
jgi:hypothetical protein